MKHLKSYVNFYLNEYNGMYTQEWPMNKQNVGLRADDVSNDQEYAKKENKFQDVQEHMKFILKPIILRKNKNAEDNDIEKVAESFFRLCNNKSQEIKQMVDSCKDTEQCAKDIVNKYLKYVKINFNTKDDINDVEQDSTMQTESLNSEDKRFLDMLSKVVIEQMKKGYEERAIETLEKVYKRKTKNGDNLIEDEYFINKLIMLKNLSEKYECYNLKKFLDDIIKK